MRTTIVLLLALLVLAGIASANIGSILCKNSSKYTCHTVRKGESWQSLFPNPSTRDVVMRVNRMNIPVRPGQTIAIPRSGGSKMDHSPFPAQISPPGRKMIHVSLHPSVLAWGAYDSQGTLHNWGPASGGRGYCPDIGRGCNTSTGKFYIYRKLGRECVSSKFPVGRGGAPMPYCMFFNGGFALHGSYTVPGYNASHGCVRLFVQDAQWLNQEFTAGDRVAVIVTRGHP